MDNACIPCMYVNPRLLVLNIVSLQHLYKATTGSMHVYVLLLLVNRRKRTSSQSVSEFYQNQVNTPRNVLIDMLLLSL